MLSSAALQHSCTLESSMLVTERCRCSWATTSDHDSGVLFLDPQQVFVVQLTVLELRASKNVGKCSRIPTTWSRSVRYLPRFRPGIKNARVHGCCCSKMAGDSCRLHFVATMMSHVFGARNKSNRWADTSGENIGSERSLTRTYMVSASLGLRGPVNSFINETGK